MVLRTARRGRNAGGSFWGCRRYPRCKGTRDAGDFVATPTPAETEATNAEEPTSQNKHIPRPIFIAASSSQRRVCLYEGASLPRRALHAINLESTGDIRRAFSQWKAEWPRNSIPQASGEIPPWLAVAGKLLRRGTLLPLDPVTEERMASKLGDLAAVPHHEWVKAATEVMALPAAPIVQRDTFDSEAERTFSDGVLPKMFPHELSRYWHRQVSVGSLTGNRDDLAANQRTDFVFSYPDIPTLVVEIDGAQHAEQKDLDAKRDALLKEFGIDVIRIGTAELNAGDGSQLRRLASELSMIKVRPPETISSAAKWLVSCRRVQQIHLLLLEALERGVLPLTSNTTVPICVRLEPWLQSADAALEIAALEDFNRLTTSVAQAIGQVPPPAMAASTAEQAKLLLTWTDEADLGPTPNVIVRDTYFPASPDVEIPRTRPHMAKQVDRHACEAVLRRVYGFGTFREGQFESVERALRSLDSLVLLPTGSGKSIAFQLSTLLRPGVGIVVDPILSLIDDQIENLKSHGIDRVGQIKGTQSDQEKSDILSLLSRGQYQFCYVSPERFQNVLFRDSLRGLTTNTPVALVAVDEAHCVSEWGHDFRPAYLNLARTAREYCASGTVPPPIMGLTGTASRSVLKDIQRELDITDFDAIVVPKSFDRPELTFEAIPCRSAEKPIRLKSLLDQLPSTFNDYRTDFYKVQGDLTRSGLVFCPHVGGDNGVVVVARLAADHLGLTVPVYTSKAPKGEYGVTWPTRLSHTATAFKRNQVSLMACTKAFGMGIDKPNVRYTVHYNLPNSIEAFYQEAGRAGRDGNAAKCFIFYSDDFPDRTARLLNPAASSLSDLRKEVQEAGWDRADDITRALYFHNASFQGFEADARVLSDVLRKLGDISKPNRVKLSFSDDTDERKLKEQALHRLVVVGAVSDYTIDYSNREFQVVLSGADKEAILDRFYRYVAAYQRQRATKAVEEARQQLARPHQEFVTLVALQLVRFVYDVIERSRRQALSEMLRICRRSADGNSIRTEILKYLERSKFADQIEAILEGDHAGLNGVPPIVEEIRSFIEAAELRGECARELEAYPDQPSLRLLRAIAEAMTRSPDLIVIQQNIEAAVKDGVSKYGLPIAMLLEIVVFAADILADTRIELGLLMLQTAALTSPDRRDAARFMIERVRKPLLDPLLAVLLTELVVTVRHLHRR